ncbi:hypothetical protein BB561_004694 [Smittium simulii]|uniref:Carbohydrate-binding module family 19 domain-containing protein n=1 Tax=Smittium simulii TaxID=133385 RepID=A0A2T9YER6_9FUNG|nr:hypothetical protein BB561_004694 [Smittium simulii]
MKLFTVLVQPSHITLLAALLFHVSCESQCQTGEIKCLDSRTLAFCSDSSWYYSKCNPGFICSSENSPACVAEESSPVLLRRQNTSTSKTNNQPLQSQTTETDENDEKENKPSTSPTNTDSNTSQPSTNPATKSKDPQCPDKFVPICKDTRTVQFCKEGSYAFKSCNDKQLCLQNNAVTDAACYDLPSDSIKCSVKDEMLCVSSINTFLVCNGAEYVYSGFCPVDSSCIIDDSKKAACVKQSTNSNPDPESAPTITVPIQEPYVPSAASKKYTLNALVLSLAIIAISGHFNFY